MLSKEQNEKIFDGQIAHSSTTSQYIFAYFTFFRVSSTYKVIVKKKNFLGTLFSLKIFYFTTSPLSRMKSIIHSRRENDFATQKKVG